MFHFWTLQHNQKGRFYVHCSCIASGGAAILLTGENGSGKTTVALECCRRLGYELVSADLAIVTLDSDTPIVYDIGNQILSVRFNALRILYPDSLRDDDADTLGYWT